MAASPTREHFFFPNPALRAWNAGPPQVGLMRVGDHFALNIIQARLLRLDVMNSMHPGETVAPFFVTGAGSSIFARTSFDCSAHFSR